MKKIFLIGTILFTVLQSSFSQDCKWEEKKQDPISDTKYVKSKRNGSWIKSEKISIGVMPYFKSYLELKDGKVWLWAHYEITTLLSLEKIQNPKLIIKLADGSKIEIASEEQFASQLLPSVNITQADLRWNISNEDVKKIGAGKITAMRISFGGQDYSFVVEEKPAQEFLKMFSCMSSEI